MARPSLKDIQTRPVSFAKASFDLQDLLRLVKKEQQAAVSCLVKLMEDSKDERLKADCAKSILKFITEISAEKERREMTRMIAQIKFPVGGGLNGSTAEDDTPYLDFETIQNPD